MKSNLNIFKKSKSHNLINHKLILWYLWKREFRLDDIEQKWNDYDTAVTE